VTTQPLPSPSQFFFSLFFPVLTCGGFCSLILPPPAHPFGPLYLSFPRDVFPLIPSPPDLFRLVPLFSFPLWTNPIGYPSAPSRFLVVFFLVDCFFVCKRIPYSFASSPPRGPSASPPVYSLLKSTIGLKTPNPPRAGVAVFFFLFGSFSLDAQPIYPVR